MDWKQEDAKDGESNSRCMKCENCETVFDHFIGGGHVGWRCRVSGRDLTCADLAVTELTDCFIPNFWDSEFADQVQGDMARFVELYNLFEQKHTPAHAGISQAA